jgi:hypothetical protein
MREAPATVGLLAEHAIGLPCLRQSQISRSDVLVGGVLTAPHAAQALAVSALSIMIGAEKGGGIDRRPAKGHYQVTGHDDVLLGKVLSVKERLALYRLGEIKPASLRIVSNTAGGARMEMASVGGGYPM